MRLTLDSIVVVVFCPKEGHEVHQSESLGVGQNGDIKLETLFNSFHFLEYPTDVGEKRLDLTQNSQRMSLRGVEENDVWLIR